MAGSTWVDLPNSFSHRALMAKLALALDAITKPEDGTEVAVRILGESDDHPDGTRLLIVGPDSPDAMIEAIESGAAGFVPLGRTTPEIVAAVTDVSAGRAAIPNEMLGALLRHVVQNRRTPQNGRPCSSSSPGARMRCSLWLHADATSSQSAANSV